MAIEITEFANVSIAVTPVGVSSGNFGILGFLTVNTDTVIAGKEITSAERFRSYTSLASVGADWATTSEVYIAATAFYGQTPTPTDFTVLMSYETAQAGILLGGGHSVIADLVAVTAGTLTLDVDGSDVAVVGIDLSGESTLDEVAVVLSAAVGIGATVAHNGTQFVVTSATTGAASSIGFAIDQPSNLNELLGLAQFQGKISVGLDVETPVDSLAAALTLGVDWTGTVTHKQFRDVLAGATGTTTLEVAQWCEAAKRIFCNTTNNLATLSSAITTDIASVLKNATLRFSLTTFSKSPAQYPSASVFGRAASVNFAGTGTTITVNLKQMPGVSAEDLTPNEFAVLRSKFASAVVQIGKTVNAYTDSRMASGSWLDTTHGLLWLENRCEVDMFNLLYQSATKVPFSQAGLNTTVSTLDRSLQAAVRNGLCSPGFLPSGEFLPEGYRIVAVELADVPSGDKGNRIYAGLTFEMVGAGALHEVTVTGSFAE